MQLQRLLAEKVRCADKDIKFMKCLNVTLLILCLALAVIGQSKNEVLIKNATVLTAIHGTLENTDILVRDGKIAKIGKGLTAGSSTKIIVATGKYDTPGIID